MFVQIFTELWVSRKMRATHEITEQHYFTTAKLVCNSCGSAELVPSIS